MADATHPDKELKTADRIMTVQTGLLATIAGVMVLVVAGAFVMHGDLREMKADLKTTTGSVGKVEASVYLLNDRMAEMAVNRVRMDALERRLEKIEGKP